MANHPISFQGGEMDQWPQNMPYRSDPYNNGPINAPNIPRGLNNDSAWGPYGYNRFFNTYIHACIH